jgi:hypothetical protein
MQNMDNKMNEKYNNDNCNIMDEKEDKELETDMDCHRMSSVNQSNIQENISELPGTVTTVTNFKDGDANIQSSSVVEHGSDIKNYKNLSNPMIVKKDSLYYCKEHPKFQNINIEEIENHLRYSKEHLQENPDSLPYRNSGN